MSDNKRSGKLSKILAFSLGGVAVLLVAAYFVVTSSGFLKSFILPKASAALGATVDAEEIALSPFSQVTLKGLNLKTVGTEPLLKADRVHAQYDLRAILGGEIKVSEAIAEGVKIRIEENADGTRNWTPLLKSAPGSGSSPPPASTAPPKLDIGRIQLSKLDFQYTQQTPQGTRQFSLGGLELKTGALRNGQALSVDLGAALAASVPAQGSNAPAGSLRAALKTVLEISLSPDLQLAGAKASQFRLAIEEAGGAFAELKDLQGLVNLDWTPSEIKQLALKFNRGGNRLGEIEVAGPFKSFEQEGRLAVQVRGIGPDVIRLATLGTGIDLGKLTLQTTNVIEITKGAQTISIEGLLGGKQLAVSHAQFKSPELDVLLKYQARLDQAKKQAEVRAFQFEATQGGAPVASASLSQPMLLDWGQGGGAPSESSFQMSLTGLRLVDWMPVVTTNSPNGLLSADVTVRSRQAGKDIAFQAQLRGTELVSLVPGRPAPPASFTVTASGTVNDFKAIAATNLGLQFASANLPALSVSGKARFDTATQAAALDADVEGSLARLTPWIPVDGFDVRDGTTRFKLHAEQSAVTNQAAPRRSIRVDGTAERLHARFKDLKVEGWSKTAILDAVMEGDILKVNQLQAQLGTPSSKIPATFGVKGQFDLKTGEGSAKTAFSRVSQEFLRPFIQGTAFGSNLVTAELEGEAHAEINPKSASSYKGRVSATNVVVHPCGDARNSKALAPVLVFEASSKGVVHEINTLILNLGSTARVPKNEIEVRGKLDPSDTNRLKANLDIASSAVDLTPWYEALAGAPSSTAPPSPAKPAATAPATEPAAVQTPFQPAQWNIRLGRLFLGEIGLSNMVCQGEIQGGKVSIKPLQFVMNRTTNAFSGDIDMGVAGYRYDLSLRAPSLALEPFVNTFVPNYRGQFQGNLIANAQVKGAGTTGTNLRKSLGGQLGVSVTNANLHIVSPRLKAILTPIAIALRLGDLLKSPLQTLDFHTDFSQGRILVKETSVRSEMLQARSTGTIPIADDLNQSPLQLPVDVSLPRGIAQKAGLLPEGTPETNQWVALPRFATVKGTLGAPETDINKLAVSGMLLKSVANIPAIAGEKAGNVLQSVGNLLTKPATPASPNPPPIPAQQPPPGQRAPAQPPAPPAAPNPIQTGLDVLNALTGGARKPANVTPAPASGTTPAKPDTAGEQPPAPKPNPPAPPKP